MKKVFSLTIIFLLCCIVAVGCSKKASKIDNKALSDEFKNAPEWVLDGTKEGFFSSVGSATIGKSGIQFARTEAMAQGRSELARQISLKVKDLVNNFTQQIGPGTDYTVDKLSKQISKQVTNETLNGSKQKDLWISPSSDLYVLMVIDPDIIKRSVRNHVMSSYRNDDAKWQQFQANNGSEELDKEIEKTFGGSR